MKRERKQEIQRAGYLETVVTFIIFKLLNCIVENAVCRIQFFPTPDIERYAEMIAAESRIGLQVVIFS